MTRAIVGYSGFVGSNLLQFYKFDFFYNSKNFEEAINMEFDELFFCGIPAVKWYANKFPEEDNENINKIMNLLKTIKINKIILFSTIDVYDNVDSGVDELYECDLVNNHTYGLNRIKFEKFIMNNFNNYHIIRLPALFGKGLKKNIIYDLLNNNEIDKISLHTSFQWYDLNWLKKDIDVILQNNIKLINLFTEPLETIKIIKLFNYPIERFNNNSKQRYNIKTVYYNKFGSDKSGYLRNKHEVLHNIRLYINFNNIDTSRLVVSNICLKNVSNFQFSRILKLYKINKVQIAPTKLLTDWKDLYKIDFSDYYKNDINIYSFQSITYGLDHLNIFNENKNELLEHIKNIINKAVEYNIKRIVFGCPKNRKINNLDNSIDNDEIFINFFKEIGNYCSNYNLIICIEPNSKLYNCNYINNIKEAGEIVKKINCSNIKMMIDIGNIIMENDNFDDIYIYKDNIYNIDISMPNMKEFTEISNKYLILKNILDEINYKYNINLEMLINNVDNELEILNNSIYNFIVTYGK
jgi:hypothetical protein